MTGTERFLAEAAVVGWLALALTSSCARPAAGEELSSWPESASQSATTR